MEIEIDTVPLLFNLVNFFFKKKKNSWLGWYLSSQETLPKTLGAWTGNVRRESPFQAQGSPHPHLRSSPLAGSRPLGCPLPPTSWASLAPNPPGLQPLPSPGSDTLLSPRLRPSQLQRPLDAPSGPPHTMGCSSRNSLALCKEEMRAGVGARDSRKKNAIEPSPGRR